MRNFRATFKSLLQRTRTCGLILAQLTFISLFPLVGVSAQDQPAPLWTTYDPPVLRADYLGKLSLELLVAGDVEVLFFVPFGTSPFRPETVETWNRAATQDIDGHVVSVFRQALEASYLRTFLSTSRRGFFDAGLLNVGRLFFDRPEDTRAHSPHMLRILSVPVNLPQSRVERIGETVQYASHVVNLVIPSFGNVRLSGNGFQAEDLARVTRLFYEHFVDAYDSIAITQREIYFSLPGSSIVGGGYNHRVRNPVEGLGRELTDDSAYFGSDGRLRNLLSFISLDGLNNPSLIIHEIAHSWWDFWDWNELTGLEAPINRSHGPSLFFPGAINGHEVVRGEDTTGFVFKELPPSKWGLVRLANPTILYRMGLIGPQEVPDTLVFENQDQWRDLFDGDTDRVEGGYRRVPIDKVIARHGTRRGPVDRDWYVGTVVVSRDGLLSGDEMNYLNFITARQESESGPPGNPSYFQSSDGLARLHTGIMPKTAPEAVNDPPLPMVDLPVARSEFPGVLLEELLPRRIEAGTEVSVSGLITDPQFPDSASALCCVQWNRKRAYRYMSGEQVCSPVVGGRFSTSTVFEVRDVGIYSLSLRIQSNVLGEYQSSFWPGEIKGIEVFHREIDQDLRQTTLYFPDFVDGGGWSVQLALSNINPAAAAEVVVEVYDQQGQSVLDLFDSAATFEIPSQGSRVFRSVGGTEIRRGWIQVRGQTASVRGLLTYRNIGTGLEVSVEPVELGNHFALFVEESSGIGTGLAIFKPDPASTIEFRIRDEDGIDPLGERFVTHPVGGETFQQRVGSIPEWFDVDGIDTEFLQDFQGILLLRSEAGSLFAPVGIRFGKRGESLSAVPVIQVSGVPESPTQLAAAFNDLFVGKRAATDFPTVYADFWCGAN